LAKRVLVIGPSNIGDAILTSGVIAAIHTRYPEAHLTLVVGERAQALFSDDPRIHTLVDADLFDFPVGRLKLALALWRYQPHVVVDLRHTLYPFLLKPLGAWRYLRQPPKTLSHMRDRHLWKLRAQVPDMASSLPQPSTSTAQGQRSPTGSADATDGTSLWFTAKDTAHVDGLQKRWHLDGARRFVLICPGARSHIKRWTAEGFARVADRLITEAHAQVVFSGEPNEESIVEEILGQMDQPAYSAVGLVTIRQLGVLMRRAHLVITNDSASLHLASCLQVPTVAIFGPTDATKYGPTSTQRRTIRRSLFCAPCEQSVCRFSHECMRFIAPDEVCHAAIELLGRGRGDMGQQEERRS
jgi:ADP-heptose:LPS heptosyltransferase